MGGVSAEQIANAREIDLLSYLQTCDPGELKPDGLERYITVSHDSLVISPEVIARCMDAGILFESRYYNPQSPHHNAAAGRTATEKIERLIAETPAFQHIRIHDRPPPSGKRL